MLLQVTLLTGQGPRVASAERSAAHSANKIRAVLDVISLQTANRTLVCHPAFKIAFQHCFSLNYIAAVLPHFTTNHAMLMRTSCLAVNSKTGEPAVRAKNAFFDFSVSPDD